MFSKKKTPNKLHQYRNILEGCIANHAQVEVSFKGVGKKFTSIILALDHEKDLVEMDEFFPADGAKLAEQGKTFQVTMHDKQGIPIMFSSKLVEVAKQQEDTIYKILFPKKIEHCQKRAAFRIKLSISERLSATFPVNEQQIDEVYIHDISFTGIQVRVKRQLTNRLKVGDIIEPFTFQINEDNIITCKLNIRRIYFDDLKEETVIAGYFLEISKEDKKILIENVCNLEREMLKKNSIQKD